MPDSLSRIALRKALVATSPFMITSALPERTSSTPLIDAVLSSSALTISTPLRSKPASAAESLIPFSGPISTASTMSSLTAVLMAESVSTSSARTTATLREGSSLAIILSSSRLLTGFIFCPLRVERIFPDEYRNTQQ